MRKSEMTQEQLRERATIVQALTAAGWHEMPQNQNFEDGFWLVNEVGMDYKTPTMNLEVQYCADRRRINLSLYKPFGVGVYLYIYYGEQLEQLLNLIVSLQDSVSETNFRDYIKQILKACPETYADLGEEAGIVRLVNDEGELVLPDSL